MKYSLYKTLMNEREILSHVFFECANEFIVGIADKNKGKTKEQIEKRKIDIELKIDGHVCDPKKFFDLIYSQYSKMVEEEATAIVKKQVSDKLSEIARKLDGYSEITESWANDINWDVPNPFIEKK